MYTIVIKCWVLCQQSSNTNGNYSPSINLDGANGVGSVAIEYVKKRISEKLVINLYNDSINNYEKLNLKASIVQNLFFNVYNFFRYENFTS